MSRIIKSTLKKLLKSVLKVNRDALKNFQVFPSSVLIYSRPRKKRRKFSRHPKWRNFFLAQMEWKDKHRQIEPLCQQKKMREEMRLKRVERENVKTLRWKTWGSFKWSGDGNEEKSWDDGPLKIFKHHQKSKWVFTAIKNYGGGVEVKWRRRDKMFYNFWLSTHLLMSEEKLLNLFQQLKSLSVNDQANPPSATPHKFCFHKQ